ncbi:MAG: ABC transporter substrate-binding protein [Peptostreptococcales bacterium]
MNKKAKVLTVILAIVMIISLIGCSQEEVPSDTPIKIGIIQYNAHGALDAARMGFIDALKDNGYEDGGKIAIDYQNAQADAANLSTIGDRFVSNKVDLVLAIATPAAQSIAGKTTEIPILGTAITDYVDARLVDSNEVPGGNVSGTTDMNPIKEQIDLMLRLAPDTKTVGFLYTSNEDNSIFQIRHAKAAVEALGLSHVEVTVSNSNEVQQATQSIIDKVDAIYIPTDNIFASAMPIVYGVTAESKTPVICAETGMVLSGGLATLGINYYDLGYQTGLMAIRIIEGSGEPASMAIEAASEFDYVINGTVAEEIGMDIPDDLKEYVVEAE